MPRDIIAYPLKPGGSKWGDNELRHSLRSLDQHWRGGGDVFLLSSKMPEWVQRGQVGFKLAPSYLDAMAAAVELADGGNILWMNDDILFLKDTSWEDLVSPVRRLAHVGTAVSGKMVADGGNMWRVRMGKVMLELERRGKDTWNFSTHTPYFYEGDKLAEIMRIYCYGYKTPFECAYYNHFGHEHARVWDKWRAQKKRVLPREIGHYRFINLTDGGCNRWVKGFVRGRFPSPSRYELPVRSEPRIQFYAPGRRRSG